MTPNYLKERPTTDNYSPPVSSKNMELPFHEITWENFEILCLRLVEIVDDFKISECEILGRKGQPQDGIDIYAKKEKGDFYNTYQSKRYREINVSQLGKIEEQFRNGEWFGKTSRFYLCTSADIADVKLQKEAEDIKKKYREKYHKQFIVWDASFFNRTLKTHPQIVNDFFGAEWCKVFCGEEAYNELYSEIDFENLQKSFKKASSFLSDVKDYFGQEENSHIDRKETDRIIEWINTDLDSNKKNLLVLEGGKGTGKSVILKNLYDQLIEEEEYLVLGIKSDNYYFHNVKDLGEAIFMNEKITFLSIIRALNRYNKKLIIIFDQLDALSETLSSDRRYILIYKRIINELLDENNMRIIISSRSYDLRYEADLKPFKNKEYSNVKASLLDKKEVKKVLQNFNVKPPLRVIEILRTPSHLEIFSKLPNKNKINLNALSSLNDLFNILWEEVVINKRYSNVCDLLYLLANKMYKEQRIAFKRSSLNNDYKSELEYLLSNQLIITNGSNLQFFHQTFYDYCLSRHFVEDERDIINYIEENEQNLEIRSILKMVLEYMRDYDHKRYINQVRLILQSSKYRFHLKTLIISDLGLWDSPSNSEKEIVSSLILKNKLYKDVFIHSVFSKGWTLFLLKKGVVMEFLFWDNKLLTNSYSLYKTQSFIKLGFLEKRNPNKIIEYNRSVIWRFLRNNINKAPLQILNHLEALPEFENKKWFIKDILIGLKDWEEKDLLIYFEKYLPYNDEGNGTRTDNLWFYEKIKNIFEHHTDYVYKTLESILKNVFDSKDKWGLSQEFSMNQRDLIEKLNKLQPEKTFNFLLNLYQDILENNKDCFESKKISSPLYGCKKFHDSYSSSEEGYIFIEDLLIRSLSSGDANQEFHDFFEEHKKSDSIFILRILVLALIEFRDSLYSKLTFELITIIHSKNGLNGYDDNFSLYMRRLIAIYFVRFSVDEKEVITDIFLSITSPIDCTYYKYKDTEGNPKVQFYGYGQKQYYFIDRLPEKEREEIPKLKRAYGEFYRRFGSINSDIAHSIGDMQYYAVGAPLSSRAYRNMRLKDWKNSMLKYDDDYQEEFGPKGGRLEHSREFRETVKENPQKYFPFLKALFDEDNISIDYLSKGISGLIDGKFSPRKTKIIFDLFIELELVLVNTLYDINQSAYFIENNLVDDKLIDFLSDKALNHSHPEKPMNEDDPAFDSLNSVRGAAVHKLISCYEFEKYKDEIFEVMNRAVYDSQVSVRIAVMQNLAFLNHLDIQKNFTLFMKLSQSDNEHILRASLNTSVYFIRDFHRKMLPYFDKIIKNKELHSGANVLVLVWLNDKVNNKKLYKRFVRASVDAKLCALKIAEANLFDKKGKFQKKSLYIFNQFLKHKEEKLASAYSGIILRQFKKSNFDESYPFLLRYSKSGLSVAQPNYFLELLIECVRDNPKRCLELIENMDFNRAPDIQKGGYYREEPVKLILLIYSKLNMDLKENKKYVKKALDIFDSFLKHNHLRMTVNKALEAID